MSKSKYSMFYQIESDPINLRHVSILLYYKIPFRKMNFEAANSLEIRLFKMVQYLDVPNVVFEISQKNV